MPKKNKHFHKLAIAMLISAFASGCATDPKTGQSSLKETFASEDPCSNNARNIGILVGSIAGAVIGNQIQHSNTSRILGAAAGAALGGFIGADMDRRRCELYKIAKRNQLEIRVEDIKQSQVAVAGESGEPAPVAKDDAALGLKVAIKDNGRQFKSGSDELSPEALGYFRQIAAEYSYEAQKRRLTPTSSREDVAAVEALKGKRILLVGHTDDVGSSELNADLSERRAKSVAKVFRSLGIGEDQLFYQGAGETLPIADNRSDEGRARNRRVEIIDLADDSTLRNYLSNRKPLTSYYRNGGDHAAAPTTSAAAAGTVASTVPQRKPTKAPTRQTSPSSDPSSVASAPSPRTASSSSSAPAAATVATTTPGVSPKPVANTAQATTSKPGTAERKSKSDDRDNGFLDFGGTVVGNTPPAVDIGKPTGSGSGVSLISQAYADEPLSNSCMQDRPRVSRGVKSLKDGSEFSTRDYLPGLYDTSWFARANGHLVALTHVAVLRDGGVPARRPQLLIYKDYQGDKAAKATFNATPEVNTYRGDKGVLYRVFVNGPLRCIDMVVGADKTSATQASNLYYDKGQATYVAPFTAKLVKN